ncbi:hypothetical protein P3T76_005351 [Phytophthora citrophthora]|uniref:LisH domain-containing protein n=1 Tax=Phytophthora citrophthora TaxID=4793 RepID=A0AAD9LNT3_9STRA|nr:hypothetical protein P3T76_005351 [Phytophthora citrophthora]
MTEPTDAPDVEQREVPLKRDEGGPQNKELKPLNKLTTFALQLMEEFLTQHKLLDTLKALELEIESKRIPLDDQLWFEMHNKCRVALARGDSNTNSTLEKLLAFCMSPKAVRAAGALALDVVAPPVTLCLSPPLPNSVSKLKQTSFTLKQAYSQMLSPVVRPSQRHKQTGAGRRPIEAKGELSAIAPLSDIQLNSLSRPSSSSSILAPVEIKQQPKKHKPKKKRDSKPIAPPSPHPLRTDSSMMMAYDEQIKRDLTTGRLLTREFRVLRAERAKCDSLRRNSASLEAALSRYDPYAKELVRERYGFIHRVDCALCTFSFLPVNLPHRVSFKCIMDLHELWGYQPPQREVAARYRPPFCYDAVSVCRMCGPILFQHTTAMPNVEQLSPTMARASSLSSLGKPRSPVDNERSSFCSDPYALPPLFGDDVIEDGESYDGEEVANEVRANGPGVLQEFPAKAMVYSQQTEFMSSKEWEVINPTRSNIRLTMENTVK